MCGQQVFCFELYKTPSEEVSKPGSGRANLCHPPTTVSHALPRSVLCNSLANTSLAEIYQHAEGN